MKTCNKYEISKHVPHIRLNSVDVSFVNNITMTKLTVKIFCAVNRKVTEILIFVVVIL
jgi:hypothetical protein